jgi:hypothetical protein
MEHAALVTQIQNAGSHSAGSELHELYNRIQTATRELSAKDRQGYITKLVYICAELRDFFDGVDIHAREVVERIKRTPNARREKPYKPRKKQTSEERTQAKSDYYKARREKAGQPYKSHATTTPEERAQAKREYQHNYYIRVTKVKRTISRNGRKRTT